jgi:hypothetical protein
MKGRIAGAGRRARLGRVRPRHAHGTFFHRLAYRDVVRDRMRHEPVYLVAKDDGVVVGALPLFLVGSPLLGRALVSVPYGVYGGASRAMPLPMPRCMRARRT